MVTVEPEILATDGSLLVNNIGRVDEFAAVSTNGGSPTDLEAKGPKVIVWLALLTVRVFESVAANQFSLPPCVAIMVVVPAPTIVMVEPDIVATAWFELE